MIIYIQAYLLTCLFILVVNGELTKLPSTIHEEDYHRTTLKDTGLINSHPEPIRIEKNTKKKFAVRRDLKSEPVCQRDINPFELRRLLKTYENDGGKVKYVSPDSLPVNETDAENLECLSSKTKRADTRKSERPDKKNGTAPETKGSQKAGSKVEKEVRRGNEYEFDTVEYYDEELNFHDSQCPGLVDVIELEMSEIRRYDVECEMISQWESLL